MLAREKELSSARNKLSPCRRRQSPGKKPRSIFALLINPEEGRELMDIYIYMVEEITVGEFGTRWFVKRFIVIFWLSRFADAPRPTNHHFREWAVRRLTRKEHGKSVEWVNERCHASSLMADRITNFESKSKWHFALSPLPIGEL